MLTRTLTLLLPLALATSVHAESGLYSIFSLSNNSRGDAVTANVLTDQLNFEGYNAVAGDEELNSDGWRLGGGGWITPHVGLEITAGSLGSYDIDTRVDGNDQTAQLSLMSVDASLLPTWRMGPASLFGRAGLANVRSDLRYGSTRSLDSTEYNISPVVGAGFEYQLGYSRWDWSVRFEWTRYSETGNSAISGRTEMDALSLGLHIGH